MLIIVEGPDGSGKTTFVRALEQALSSRRFERLEMFHARPPKDHPLNEYEKPLLSYRPGTFHNIICDRWHWGESIYPQVLGRDTQFDLAVRRHVELFLRSRGAVVAYMSTPPDVAAKRIKKRGDDLISPQQIGQLHSLYESTERRSLLYTYKVRQQWTTDNVMALIRLARSAEVLVRQLVGFNSYVGSPTPELLLLGDVRHELRAGHTPAADFDSRWGAFGPFPATSGHYLLSHLHTIRCIGLANACDVDDWRVLHTVLGRPHIVTLGGRAHDKLGSFPHGAVPHPQFIRRFHHSAGAQYATLIENNEGEDQFAWRP